LWGRRRLIYDQPRFVLPNENTPVDAEGLEELSISEFEAEADATPALVEERERKFGRYRLKYQIASGGMASVFLAGAAGAAGFEKPVAIKRMHPHLARRKAYVDMFLDEAKITSRINHPNVCQVFDFGQTDGAYYMAMEYLVGEPLTTILAHVKRRTLYEAPQWQAIAARVCASVGEGLHAAHELRDNEGQPLDVVHRDVSPSNIIVTFDGGVKVVDFGVAKARGRIHQTTTGTLKGKFSYMAPEQVSGHAVDRRSDVWSVGVCLWEMMTCKRLFRRPSEMETLIAVGQGEIDHPSVVNPAVPESLATIALKALSRDPAARYESTRAMSRDLEAWLRTQEHPAGMADIADFLTSTLSREHSSKILFVQTAMHERSAEVKVASQATRVLEGTPSNVAPVPPFSESQSHTRPRAPGEEPTTMREAGTNPFLLYGIAAVLLATLVAAIAGVVLALGGDDADEVVATPLPPTPTPTAAPDVVEGETEDEASAQAEVEAAEAAELLAQRAALSEAQGAELSAARARIEELERREAERERAAAERAEARAERTTAQMSRPAMTSRPPGTLFLTGGGARVTIDGEPRGRTPWRGELAAGRHSVVIRKNGQSRQITVTIQPGRTKVQPIGL